jgi:hypothetical protein
MATEKIFFERSFKVSSKFLMNCEAQLPSFKLRMKAFFYLQTLLLLIACGAFAQDIQIKYGKTSIGLNEYFTISIVATNAAIESYGNFPDLPGFNKAGISSSSSTNIINGQVTSTNTIIQNYQPQKEGKIKIPAFTMKVNGVVVKGESVTVNVGPPVDRKVSDPFGIDPFSFDPFEDYFRGEKKEFVDIKEDAFFAVNVSKDDIYMGEGFNTTVSFFVSDENAAEMQFYDLSGQLQEIIRKIKPANCWEENFGIEEIVPRKVKIGNKGYTEYRMYQATFFPLSAGTIEIPSVKLKIIKYKYSNRPSIFGGERVEDFKDFYSKPKTIKVRDLPPHPKKDIVAVGTFKLKERLSKKEMAPYESVGYDFEISGEGNIAALRKPDVSLPFAVGTYDPSTSQSINRSNGRVYGEKVFSYLITPKEAGEYDLKDDFSWIYFDTERKRYDTLRSTIAIKVVGKPMIDELEATDPDAAQLRKIDNADNTLKPLIAGNRPYDWMNYALGGMFLIFIFLLFYRKST